ncbi:hypothetical protein FRB97_008428 [Tulasnella sp. 331]|nr:hypothetical protein FRB97_008428 [Tulasnella sp. 331]KAG8884554.1 hypothetical protein FRB98_002341 [Tulasnella sp. 332]
MIAPPRTPLQPRLLNHQHHHQLAGPFSSPVASGSSSPCAPSSPLNPYSHSSAKHHYSLTSKGDQNRRASYKTRRPAYSLAAATAASVTNGEEVPRKALLRDRMKAKCAARIEQDRTKSKKKKSKGLFDQSSSDGGDMDYMMDEDDEGEDSMDDPLFLRFMAADMRRDKHRQEYNFQRQVGSSFDPELEDIAEWETYLETGEPASPKLHAVDDYEDDDELDEEYLCEQYEAYLEQEEITEASSTSMELDAHQPQHDHSSEEAASRSLFLNHILATSCLKCHQALTISLEVEDAVSCTSCRTTYPLNEAASSWTDDHPSLLS